ncbi:MAG: DUF975 family protein [Clostridia bacterium]|nr:DUF975 family protein [Clostridia bacterium]
MNRQELKARAKSQLGGIFEPNWIYALLISLIASLIISAASVVPVLGSLIVWGPMMYAVSKALLKLSRTGEKPDLNVLVDGFKDDFGETLLIGLLSTIFICLWSLLFVIPGIVKSYAYSMAYYIKVDHPEYDWRKCLKESEALTKGHKGELFVLDLSFIGWLIVGSLCLGVGVLWVAPYMDLTKANFYNDLVAQQTGTVEFEQEDSTFSEFEG